MSRETSNIRAFCFRAPACINQHRLGYAVTKNAPVSEVHHMFLAHSACPRWVSRRHCSTHPQPRGWGRKTDTEELHVYFPQPHILLAGSSHPALPEKLGNRHATLAISNTEKGLSKFYWEATSTGYFSLPSLQCVGLGGHRMEQVTLL